MTPPCSGVGMGMALAAWKFDSSLPEPALLAVDLSDEIQTLDQLSAVLPGGAYTTFRTYQRFKTLRLQDHLQRLEQTTRLAGMDIPLNPAGLRSAIRQGLALFSAGYYPGAGESQEAPENGDFRLRLTIDLEQQPGLTYLAVQPLQTPNPAEYQHGVQAVTAHLERMLPEAKLTRFIKSSQLVRRALPPDVNEALMVDHAGFITEGLSSNFFAILNGQIWTAGERVLAGVTRSLALECIRLLDLSLVYEPVPVDKLPDLEEAFITSSSRGLLPLSRIDQTLIGDGRPGPVTRRLMAAFDHAVAEQLLPI